MVGAVTRIGPGEEDLVFITSDAQLLRFSAGAGPPAGSGGGGIAGIKVAAGQRVVFFGAVDPAAEAVVVTSSGPPGPSRAPRPVPSRRRRMPSTRRRGAPPVGCAATASSRGEDTLILAWAGATPARAAAANGVALELPPAVGDATAPAPPAPAAIARIAGPLAADG